MSFSPATVLYHVTPSRNVFDIGVQGLVPRVGERSAKLGEDPAIFLFTDLQTMEDALLGWLGEEFDEGERLVVLRIVVPHGFADVVEAAGFEHKIRTAIPPSMVSVYLDDVDDLVVDPSSRAVAMVDPDKETVEAAQAFALARWREWHSTRCPDEPTPVDLSGSCKFTSCFARGVFGGDLAANDDHQFVVLADGRVLDLNRDAGDVTGMEAPYHAVPGETYDLDTAERIASRNPNVRVDRMQPPLREWIERFVREMTHEPAAPSP